MKPNDCLLVLFLFPSAVSAAPVSAKIDAARIGVDCKDDFQRLCKDVAGGSVMQCMQRHRSQVSAACLSAMDGTGAPPAPAGKRPPSCKDDYVRVCKGVKSAELKKCLRDHRKELSDFCRKIFDMSESKKKSPAH